MKSRILHPAQIFQFALLAFFAGVAAAPFLPQVSAVVAAAASLILSIVAVTVWWGSRGLAAAAIIIACAAGFFRFQAAGYDAGSISNYNGRGAVALEGVVIEEPDIRAQKINYVVSVRRRMSAEDRGVSGRVLVSAGRYPEYRYGDMLRIEGKLETPFESEEFSYKKYLEGKGIYSVINYARLNPAGKTDGSRVVSALLRFKSYFSERLAAVLPEPYNSLALGLLVGARRQLPQDLLDLFKIAGVTHIIAISGFNISIITRILGNRVRKIGGPKLSFAVSALVVAGFVVITGAAASVVRAAIMGLLGVAALNIGRKSQALGVLLAAAGAMVAFNPRILAADLGFQLSFLATAGLIFFAEPFERFLKKIPEAFELRTTLASTLAAQVLVMPLLIYSFGQISLVSPIVNMFVLPAVPVTMLVGFAAGALACIWIPLALVPAWIAWALLFYQLRVIEWFARLPGAAIGVPALSISWIAAYYIIVLAIVFILSVRQRERVRNEFYSFSPS